MVGEWERENISTAFEFCNSSIKTLDNRISVMCSILKSSEIKGFKLNNPSIGWPFYKFNDSICVNTSISMHHISARFDFWSPNIVLRVRKRMKKEVTSQRISETEMEYSTSSCKYIAIGINVVGFHISQLLCCHSTNRLILVRNEPNKICARRIRILVDTWKIH